MSTEDEVKKADSRKLDALIFKLMEAVRADEYEETQEIKEEIRMFADEIPNEELHIKARTAILSVSLDQMEEAFEEIAEFVENSDAYVDTIRAATRIAEERKASLLLPLLASQTGKMIQVITALKDASEVVESELDDVDGFEDIPEAISNVLSTIEDLESKVKATLT